MNQNLHNSQQKNYFSYYKKKLFVLILSFFFSKFGKKIKFDFQNIKKKSKYKNSGLKQNILTKPQNKR